MHFSNHIGDLSHLLMGVTEHFVFCRCPFLRKTYSINIFNSESLKMLCSILRSKQL